MSHELKSSRGENEALKGIKDVLKSKEYWKDKG